jgi:hypothetical protein
MQIFWQRKITRTRTRASEGNPYKFFDEESEMAYYEVEKAAQTEYAATALSSSYMGIGSLA